MSQTTNELKIAFADSKEKLNRAGIVNGKMYCVDNKLYYDFNGIRYTIDEDAENADIDGIFEDNNESQS